MKKRNESLDVCRGILICLVVIGHIIPYKTWIYSFHIPAFFFISGMLINEEKYMATSLPAFVKKKFLSLIVPYLFFEFLGAVENLIISGFTLSVLKSSVINTLSVHCNVGADWFLPTLFFAELFYFLCVKYKLFCKVIFRVLISVSMLSVVFLIPSVIQINYIIVDVLRVLLAFAFLNIGRLFSVFIDKIPKRINILCLVSAYVVNLIICFVNSKVEMWDCEFGNPVLYLLAAVSGFVFVYGISKMISSKFISNIGINSIIIMGTHQLILRVFDTMKISSLFSELFLYYFVEIIAVFIVEVIIVWFINRYLYFLVGKKKNECR